GGGTAGPQSWKRHERLWLAFPPCPRQRWAGELERLVRVGVLAGHGPVGPGAVTDGHVDHRLPLGDGVRPEGDPPAGMGGRLPEEVRKQLRFGEDRLRRHHYSGKVVVPIAVVVEGRKIVDHRVRNRGQPPFLDREPDAAAGLRSKERGERLAGELGRGRWHYF